MSILSALRQQRSSIDDLAKLPQAMIMQMAQKKEISPEMVAPILSRKAEMMEAVARSKALQQPAMQPTVMEKVMAKNIQAENPAPQMPMQQPMPQAMQQAMPQEMPQMPEEAGVAQLQIPERQYAGGGIIAFADGGMSDEDDDYEDALEEADYQAMVERAMNAGEDDSTPRFETKQAAGSPQSFPNTARKVGIATPKEQKGDLEERLRAAILKKESGGKRYNESGKLLTSPKGAEGEMQVMPYTARDPGFGIKPARSNDPDELRRVGDEYASAMLRRYRDPKLAMIAYNMGPGATDKWLAAGADVRKLPKETQGYISNVNLAHGGEVKHFQSGGSSMGGFEDFYTDLGIPLTPEIDEYTVDPMTGQKISSGYRGKPSQKTKQAEASKAAPKTEIPQAGLTADEMIAGSTRAGTFEAMMKDQTTGLPVVPAAKAEVPKSQFEMYMEDLANRSAENKKQRADDKNMALLTAGLGMLGGTSPYAGANIGQGALAGVQNLSESRKQRAAEQAAIDKSMLYATRYKGADELAKANAAYNRGAKQQQYNLDVEKLGTEQQKIAISQYETHINNAIKSLDKNPLIAADPAARAAAEDKILNSPTARALYKRAYGDVGMEPQKSNTMRFDASGKQITG